MEISMKAIGKIKTGKSFSLELDAEYAPGLKGLKGFSHVLIVWYAHGAPTWDGSYLVIDKPYRLAPEKLGIFATRSPYRPNNVCVSVAPVSGIDEKAGVIHLHWTDAENDTPVLDVKPYQPCLEVVRDVKLPDWCSHWPACNEDSATFAWDREFLF